MIESTRSEQAHILWREILLGNLAELAFRPQLPLQALDLALGLSQCQNALMHNLKATLESDVESCWSCCVSGVTSGWDLGLGDFIWARCWLILMI